MKRQTPAIHLWIFNHKFFGISDQVAFFLATMRRHGYRVSLGRQPRPQALNVIIENLSRETAEVLRAFCRDQRKRVAVIMTEHIDFVDQRLTMHGQRLWADNDYMHPVVQADRLRYLFDCLDYIQGFLVLGDLPRLTGMDQLCPGIPVRHLEFPALDTAVLPSVGIEPRYDLAFAGYLTKSRRQRIQRLSHRFTVHHAKGLLSRHRRDDLLRSARVNLNLAQRDGWPWLSSMRVLAALAVGRVTLSIGTEDTSWMTRCCRQWPTWEPDLPERLHELTATWRDAAEEALAAYQQLARDFAVIHPFPRDFLESWAVTDRL